MLIPPELGEAHLAGFTQLQVTGARGILEKTLHVPALRRDGSPVAVALAAPNAAPTSAGVPSENIVGRSKPVAVH